MNIPRVDGAHGRWPLSSAGGSSQPQSAKGSSSLRIPQDQLDISPAAQLMLELSNLDAADGPERLELINRIREEIAQGTYDTDGKLEAAFQKFLEQHGMTDE